MKDHFLTFAAYNNWANELLYSAAESLDDNQLRKDLGAFFGSVHATLNHILVGDTVWMDRFQNMPSQISALNANLFDDFDDLKNARKNMDQRIIDYIDELGDDHLKSDFTYETIVNPETVSLQLAPALAHFFNHQTHHRGQIHAMLTRLTGKAPSIDLLYFQREQMDKVEYS